MGSDFVRFLVEKSLATKIAIYDNFSYSADVKRVSGLEDAVEIVRGDIRELEQVVSSTRGFDLVVNFAAETHNDNSLLRPLDFVSSNVEGVANLLEAARKNDFRLHQVSTDEVFGDMRLGSADRFDESSPIKPSSPYSASKAAAELLVEGWGRSFGVSATISNSANNFGPWQHPEKFIPRMARLIREGYKPQLYGNGQNVRDWLHVRDHSSGLWEIITKGQPGGRYILSAHQLRSNLEIVACLNKAFGKDFGFFEFVPDRPGHDLQYASSSAFARESLGWKPCGPSVEEWIEESVRAGTI